MKLATSRTASTNPTEETTHARHVRSAGLAKTKSSSRVRAQQSKTLCAQNVTIVSGSRIQVCMTTQHCTRITQSTNALTVKTPSVRHALSATGTRNTRRRPAPHLTTATQCVSILIAIWFAPQENIEADTRGTARARACNAKPVHKSIACLRACSTCTVSRITVCDTMIR